MTTATQTAPQTGHAADNGEFVPPLHNGDHLDSAEFERRYRAMPHVNKAELIEGIVFMPSPVSHDNHSRPHGRLMACLGVYLFHTPGIDLGDNATVRLDMGNVPQPDVLLMILPERGAVLPGLHDRLRQEVPAGQLPLRIGHRHPLASR